MKKLLAILISLCMVSAFAVPVFADANSDYIAAVKAYQAQIAAKEAAYTAAVDAYSKNAKAKADADSAAILKAAKAAQAKADADCLAVIAAGKAAQSQADARVAAVIAAGKATQAKADAREAAYAKAVKAYQFYLIIIGAERRERRSAFLLLFPCLPLRGRWPRRAGGRRPCGGPNYFGRPQSSLPHRLRAEPPSQRRPGGQGQRANVVYCSFASVASASSRMRSNFSRAASTGAGVARSTPAWRSSSSG